MQMCTIDHCSQIFLIHTGVPVAPNGRRYLRKHERFCTRLCRGWMKKELYGLVRSSRSELAPLNALNTPEAF